jgi:Lon protease-like protein
MPYLAMFPLGSVLFPGAVLPLHVFEPRYRELVQHCLEGDEHEFGVALITRGSEVGGGDIRSMVATVARIVQVAQLEDGRYALITVGTRRVRVERWLEDDPYPIAEVHDWPDVIEDDNQGALEADLAATLARVRRINALASELGQSDAEVTPTISTEGVLGTYHLCALAPLGPADQQRLLCAAGPVARLALLNEALDDVEALLLFRLQHESGGEMPDDVGGP